MAEQSKQGTGTMIGAPSPQPEKTANWPANPGPTQPKDRGAGTPKIKQSMLEDL
jgi:hypothetical protein